MGSSAAAMRSVRLVIVAILGTAEADRDPDFCSLERDSIGCEIRAQPVGTHDPFGSRPCGPQDQALFAPKPPDQVGFTNRLLTHFCDREHNLSLICEISLNQCRIFLVMGHASRYTHQ